MNISDIEQDNVIDGGPLIIDPHYHGTFITIMGHEESPLILALSTDDLKVYHEAYIERLQIDSGQVGIEPHPEVEE